MSKLATSVKWIGLILFLFYAGLCSPAYGQGGYAITCSLASNPNVIVQSHTNVFVNCQYHFTATAPGSSSSVAVGWSFPNGGGGIPPGVTIVGGSLSSPTIDVVYSSSANPSQPIQAMLGSNTSIQEQYYVGTNDLSTVAIAASANPICVNTPLTLSLTNITGVNSAYWIGYSVSTDPSNGFALQVPNGITGPTTFQVSISGGCGPSSVTVMRSITIIPLTDNLSQVAGERDVLTGANQGTVTLTNYNGTIQYWQSSPDNGVTSPWTTLNQTTEDLSYTNLTATTFYRAVTSLCGATYTSASCPIRVHAVTDDLSWTETKTFALDGTTLLGDSRTYVDGFAKPLQSQAKSLSTGKVLATQPLYGKYDQAVGSTLAAPITPTDFAYQSAFVTPASSSSTPYDYTRFDDTNTLNAPEAVSNTTRNTLGWYYSANNDLERYTATTSFPYSRTDAMPDGSTGVSRMAGPSPGLQLGGTTADGKTHEVVQGSFPVRTELDTYTTIRNNLFTAAVVGSQVTTLKQASVQQLSTDADGNTTLVFSDKEGHAVMSARPATSAVVAGQPDAWLTAINTVEIGWPYSVQLPANMTLGASIASAFTCTADIMVFDNQGNWLVTGSPDAIAGNPNVSGNVGNYLFFSTSAFTVAASPTAGGTSAIYSSQQREAYPFFNFYVVGDGSISITNKAGLPSSAYTLVNTVTGQLVSFSNGTALPVGCYQLRIVQGAVNLTYTNRYKDISYNFYNQKGQLLESIAPLGVRQLLQNVTTTGAPLASTGQMGYWRFTEGAGTTVADASGQGLTGTLQGAVAWGPSYIPAQQSALVLNGGGYVDIGDQPAVRMGTTLTLEAWVKPNFAGGSSQSIINKENEYEVVVFSDGTVQCAFQNSSGPWYWIPTGITLANDTWAQVTVTYDNGTINSYLNGNLVTTQTGGAGPIQYSGGPLWIGARQCCGYYFTGSLDEVRVWNVARTPADIASSFQASQTGSAPFSTTFEYDQQGRQTAVNETDGGRSEFVYRADGKLRFSQNAKQRASGYFAYLNYDTIGRVVEAGENQGGNALFASCKADPSILEYVPTYGTYDDGGMGRQTRKSVIRTYYDQVVTSFSLPSGYTPTFLSGRVAATQKIELFIPTITIGETSHTVYSYDEQGRTQWQAQQTIGTGQPASARTIDYTYDAAGNTATVCYQKNVPTERLTHYYTYDADNRLSMVQTSTLDPTNYNPYAYLSTTEHARYSYYLTGQLKRVTYGSNLQGVDYTYTAAGQLKSINDGDLARDPGQDGLGSSTTQYTDFFGSSLNYYLNDYTSAAVPSTTTYMASGSDYSPHYNGLISGTSWQTQSSSSINAYGYNYDYKGQLLKATYGRLANYGSVYVFYSDPNRYQEGNLDYDANGNIGHLQRTDGMGAATLAGAYSYAPGTNQLNQVLNAGSPAVRYSYDAIGQVTTQQESDPTKTKYLEYDASGKVTALYADAAHNQPIARYTYDEFGKRLLQQVYPNPLDQSSFTTTTFVRDAAGHEIASYISTTTNYSTTTPILYEQPIYGATRLGIYRQARDQTPAEQLYELNDQLGNTRVVFRRPVTTSYVLSMEDGRVNQEQQDFPGPTSTTYTNTRSSEHYYAASAYNAGTGLHYSVKLTGQQGPTKTILAQRGDKITLSVQAAYLSSSGTVTNAFTPVLIPLSTAGRQVPAATTTETAKPVSGLARALSTLSVGVTVPFGRTNQLTMATQSLPQAALQYVILKADDNSYVRNGSTLVDANGQGNWEQLQLSVTITENYPVKVVVSTQNYDGTQPVYFDDLTVQYTPGPVIEENHYYAYGQRLDGLNWRRTDERLYGRGYQGQNTTQDAESGYTAFDLRMYDARYGRWLMGDPYGQFNSPYTGMGNNPVSGVDPDGGWLFGLFGSTAAQRQNARDFADANNGTVEDYFRSSIHVNWSDSEASYATRFTPNGTPGSIGSPTHDIQLDYIAEQASRQGFHPDPGIAEPDFATSLTIIPLLGVAGRAITTGEGFLLGSIRVTAPFDINVQRFGGLVGPEKDFALRVGPGRMVNRLFSAIKPEWNDLTNYNLGVIPKGTSFRIGIAGPQFIPFNPFPLPGGLPQFRLPPSQVIIQSTTTIVR